MECVQLKLTAFGDDISENPTSSIYKHHNPDTLYSQRALNPRCHMPSPGFMFQQKQRTSRLTKELSASQRWLWLMLSVSRKHFEVLPLHQAIQFVRKSFRGPQILLYFKIIEWKTAIVTTDFLCYLSPMAIWRL